MAIIIPFAARPAAVDCFLVQDKIELCRWETALKGVAISRIAIHDGGGKPGPQNADFALVYEPDAIWAAWGLSREARGVVLWECAYGKDMDVFPLMVDALEALSRYVVKWERRA